MVNYRRNHIPGGTFFFTVTLQNRKSSLLINHIDILRQSIKATKQKKPFHIDAIVILPDHIHTIWTLPYHESDYSGRWRLIKSKFTRALLKNTQEKHQIWQSRFWEHTIQDDRDLESHINYIHYNPVKHNLVSKVSDWPYSSFHRFVESGIISKDWGGQGVFAFDGRFGE